MEVDEIIFPEHLGAIAAKNALMGGDVRATIDVTPSLQVLELPGDPRVLAFDQAGEPMGIPPSDDPLEEGDRLAVLADFDVLEDVDRIVVGGDGLPTRRQLRGPRRW